jgi:hypothetical protein
VHFTREPTIETIISPREEGYKLLVRNTKGEKAEEYYVDAVEVVSFGRAFFFRSLEKPKAFLVPTGDYEILEVREARIALKNVSHERSIKIGGGRENARAPAKEIPAPEKELTPVVEQSSALETVESTTEEVRTDKRRDRHRRRRRRHIDEQQEQRSRRTDNSEKESNESKEEQKGTDEEKISSPMLIPPPPILISETLLSRYKDKDLGQSLLEKKEEIITHEEILEQQIEPKVEEKKEEENIDKDPGSEGTAFSRSILNPPAFTENINTDFLF